MNESSSILVSEIADLRQHLAAAVQEVSDTHYACNEKLLAAQSVCSDWVDRYRKAVAERDKVQCDLAHTQFDRDAALNLVEAAEARARAAEARAEHHAQRCEDNIGTANSAVKKAEEDARLSAAEAAELRNALEYLFKEDFCQHAIDAAKQIMVV